MDEQETLSVGFGSLAGWHRSGSEQGSGALRVKASGKELRPGGLKCTM